MKGERRVFAVSPLVQTRTILQQNLQPIDLTTDADLHVDIFKIPIQNVVMECSMIRYNIKWSLNLVHTVYTPLHHMI